jgi:VTC domain-containing protein
MEVKYSVPEDLAAWTLKWSGVFLQRDYGLTGPQHVTSLYLDTPTLTFFRWHREDRADRFKLRIRGYGDSTRNQVWAEIKRKTGGVIHKERAPLSVQALDAVLRGAGAAPSSELEEFVKRRQAFHALPKLLLNCQRDALRDKRASGEVAVTVDRFIRYQPTHRHDLVDDPQLWRAVLLPCPAGPARAIIELKYMVEAPTWMATLMRRLAPYRVGFSKYRAAMQLHTLRAKS